MRRDASLGSVVGEGPYMPERTEREGGAALETTFPAPLEEGEARAAGPGKPVRMQQSRSPGAGASW